MIRFAAVLMLCLLGSVAAAQRSEVRPSDAEITVTIENPQAPYRTGEMVLLTIHGVYRRHITREALIQPDLNGFGWMQLGEDYWHDSTERGQKVKNMRRRMAVFPNRDGTVEIGAFRHRLTFLDENLKWFDHEISSEPIRIEVTPADPAANWWLPVHRLEIEDRWSNPPDQLQSGDGVLRVIRVEAHGASPDMLPPMPELKSPSALIYPHPEKRLVELTPRGPVAIGYWRWTIRPTNDVSTIVEPFEVAYFDTLARESRRVEVSAQRVAYGNLTGDAPTLSSEATRTATAAEGERVARRAALLGGFGVIFLMAGAVLLRGLSLESRGAILRRLGLDKERRALRRAEARSDPAAFRRAAHRAAEARNMSTDALPSLKALDAALFAKEPQRINFAMIRKSLKKELETKPM